uniref:Uncharacterized protein n=1 Tax=Arundo donax TaxID=35708 RepID=A0A0A8ZRB4_ARUDO
MTSPFNIISNQPRTGFYWNLITSKPFFIGNYQAFHNYLNFIKL